MFPHSRVASPLPYHLLPPRNLVLIPPPHQLPLLTKTRPHPFASPCRLSPSEQLLAMDRYYTLNSHNCGALRAWGLSAFACMCTPDAHELICHRSRLVFQTHARVGGNVIAWMFGFEFISACACIHAIITQLSSSLTTITVTTT